MRLKSAFLIVFNFCALLVTNSKAQTNCIQYIFIAPNNGTNANLLDLNHAVYHSWNLTGASIYSYMINGDTLLRSVTKAGNSFNGGPVSGQVQMVDWNGNVVWNYVYSTAQYCSHHDIHYMPKSDLLFS